MAEQQTVSRSPEQGRQTPWSRLKQSVGPRLRRIAVLLFLLVALAAAAFLIWKLFFAKRGAPENLVTLSGRIEGDRDAYTRLARTGAVSERQGKEAASKAAQQAAAVAAAKRRYEAACGALDTAKANLVNPLIRGAEAEAARKQITQQKAEIAAANAGAEQARAQLREAEENRRDLIVTAPFDGTITTRSAEHGEVLTAGTPLVTILDLTKVYLRGFIPIGEIGKVKVGQPARVYLDSNPDQPLEAYVSRIDPDATFTPENTYFRDEHVKQVVGVKLQLKAGFGFAKPGMPADGEILIQGDKWPEGKWRR
jgi:HlyD family secretion protein